MQKQYKNNTRKKDNKIKDKNNHTDKSDPVEA
jgi:hypothetical protein